MAAERYEPAAGDAAGQEHLRQRRAVLAIVLASYLMILLDTSIVITGLPDIRDGLGFSPTGLSWVQNAYTLFFGGLLMLGARAGDLVGRRRAYLCGLSLFTFASFIIGCAQSPAMLLVARAMQGAGAAVLAPATLALLSTHFPEGEERNRALSLYAATAGVGASLGLFLGGVFAGWISWRVGFFMNVPVGIALFVAARLLLAETGRSPGRLDLVGGAISTLGMGALVYGIVRSATAGWGDAVTLACVGAGLTLLGGFFLHQHHASAPLLPLRLLKDQGRAGAYAARMLFVGAMVSFFFFSTQFMQGVLGFSPFEAGLGFLPLTLVSFAASMALPRLIRRFGNGRVLALALAATAIGMAWLAHASANSSYWTAVALPMLLLGFGNGTALGPLTVAGVRGVEYHDAGAASGLVNVAHQLGGTLGLGILIVVFAAAHHEAATAGAVLAGQISTALAGGALFLLAGFVVTLLVIMRAEAAAGT